MDKISIIIPVYNSEPYLRQCLDSLANQTYKNLEILCIDDGSTDNSADICDEYARKDSRFLVVHKGEKGGSGSPHRSMNIGLTMFSGEYVGFSDPDDWMEPDMIEELYNTLKHHNTAISIANFYKDSETASVAEVGKLEIPNGVLTPENMIEYSFRRDCYKGFEFPMWNKLYSSWVLRKNKGLFFNPEFSLAFDALWNVSVFLVEGCTGAYNNKPLYHWRLREDSIYHSATFEMKFDDFKVFKIIINMLNQNGYSSSTIWVKRVFAYWASLIAEEAIKAHNGRLLLRAQDEMRCYVDEYLDINSEYPDRIVRFHKLLNAETGGH